MSQQVEIWDEMLEEESDDSDVEAEVANLSEVGFHK